MKDWHWFIVFFAIFITPMLPAILRGKCPACRKRKLQLIETLKVHSEGGEAPHTYITVYTCDHCHKAFKRIRSGALENSSHDEYKILKEAAVLEDAV